MNENIEAGRLFLTGMLNELGKNLGSDDYLEHHGNFVNTLGLYKKIYPGADLEIFEVEYNLLMKRRWAYLKTGKKKTEKEIIFSETIDEYLVEVELLDKEKKKGHFLIEIPKKKSNNKTIYASFIDLNLNKDEVMDYIKEFKEIDEGKISESKLEELALVMINKLYV